MRADLYNRAYLQVSQRCGLDRGGIHGVAWGVRGHWVANLYKYGVEDAGDAFRFVVVLDEE